ncbi:MAG: extracellular solute-binding protein [Chloroflexi bacterium]|nr:extracellular solute-binding protein [Chloroflexota bacterium]
MAKRGLIRVAFVVIALLLAASCRPSPAPAPAPTSPAPASPLPAPIAAPQPAGQDDPWAKTVAAAKKEGAITVYSTGFISDVGQRVAAEFRKEFGIRMDILVGNGATLLQKILVEQSMKQAVADVFIIGGAGSTSDLIMRGGAASVAGDLPVLRDKSVFKVDPVYSPGGEGIVWVLAYSGANVNINQVKPEDYPKSYKDLLNPKWKGKIITSDPLTTGGSTPVYYVPRYYKVVDLDFYRQFAKQDVKFWGGNPREAAMMVARGEYLMEVGNSTDTVGPLMAAGAPLQTVAFTDGVTGQLGNVVVAKGPPHPNAARVFVNWLLSPAGQRAYTEAAHSTPVRKDVPDFVDPHARMDNPKVLARTWDLEQWAVKDQAAKTMEQIFGAK